MRTSKFQKFFSFFETLSEANSFAKRYTANATSWQKKRFPAVVTEWYSSDKTEFKFIVWYSI